MKQAIRLVKDTSHFFLHSPLFSTIRDSLVNDVNAIFTLHNVTHLLTLLQYGHPSLNRRAKKRIVRQIL